MAIAVSRGIGVGPAVFLPAFDIPSERRELATDLVANELGRLHYGVERSRSHLDKLAHKASAGDSISSIFDAHLLILDSFVAKVEDRIQSSRINAEWAIDEVLKETLERQGSHAAEHLREKQLDLKDVAAGIADELRNSDRVNIPPGSVIITREIRPSAVMEIARTAPAALVTRRGGWTSHSSILARELGIPMVTGAELGAIRPGDTIIADGYTGEIIIRPGGAALAYFRTDRHAKVPFISDPLPQNETTTLDGIAVTIRVNAESSRAYQTAYRAGAVGVGLFRSESLIPKSGKLPTEDQQTAAYLDIADAVGDAGVNIRTFDIGPDIINGITSVERNPSLGLRSIRLSLAEPELLETQIRAVLRANDQGNISIVVPMVSGLSEITRLREVLHAAADSLAINGKPPKIPRIGAMIEIPSAILTAREIAREVDFFCLGTNDLVQYLLAVDRDNERVAEWYQTLHPAVLRAIREVVAAAREAVIPVTACGEMAGSPFYVPLLIGLGIRELSMSGNSIATARRLIAGITIVDAELIAIEALTGKTAAEIDSSLRRTYGERWPDLFPEGFLDSPHS